MACAARYLALSLALLSPNLAAAQMSPTELAQRAPWCVDYATLALQIHFNKQMMRPAWTFQQAAEFAAAHAYGPHGEVYRSSEQNADAYMALAAAAYFSKDPRASIGQSFGRWANEECMRGNLLSADSGSPPRPDMDHLFP